jgi:predicted Zn-dependent protease
MKQLIRRLRFVPVLALGTVALTSCPVNPATGERQFILLSENQEIRMGQEYAKQVDASLGLCDDAGLQAYVSEMGQKLAAQSERPNLPWSFKVVDDPVVNAFALPGGPIYVTRGILGYFNSEAELAAVLGHEISEFVVIGNGLRMLRT